MRREAGFLGICTRLAVKAFVGGFVGLVGRRDHLWLFCWSRRDGRRCTKIAGDKGKWNGHDLEANTWLREVGDANRESRGQSQTCRCFCHLLTSMPNMVKLQSRSEIAVSSGCGRGYAAISLPEPISHGIR
jgi:hypothetical protein